MQGTCFFNKQKPKFKPKIWRTARIKSKHWSRSVLSASPPLQISAQPEVLSDFRPNPFSYLLITKRDLILIKFRIIKHTISHKHEK